MNGHEVLFVSIKQINKKKLFMNLIGQAVLLNQSGSNLTNFMARHLFQL
jgi:uncharacterized metal-binding protein